MRNYLAHLAHGMEIAMHRCHKLADLSEVVASDAQMFMDKGESIVILKELSFKINQDGKKWSQDSRE